MNAIELFLAGGKPTGIHCCEECRRVHGDRDRAEACCAPLRCECGAACPDHYASCDECRWRKQAEVRRARFDAAEKVTRWDGPVADADGSYLAGNLAELLELLEIDDGQDLPEYVWTCHAHPVCTLDYDTIIEKATAGAHPEFDPDTLLGAEELKDALKKFNAANRNHMVWERNYDLALLLGGKMAVED